MARHGECVRSWARRKDNEIRDYVWAYGDLRGRLRRMRRAAWLWFGLAVAGWGYILSGARWLR